MLQSDFSAQSPDESGRAEDLSRILVATADPQIADLIRDRLQGSTRQIYV